MGMDWINVVRVDVDLGGDRFRDSQFSLLDLRFAPYPALHCISALECCPCTRPVKLLDFPWATHLGDTLVRNRNSDFRPGGRCPTGREDRGETLMAIFIFIIEIASVVVGQVFVKHAMEESNRLGFGNRRVLTLFFSGVASLTISFFLTIALLQHFDLSFFYPIQGSTVVLIVLAAVVFLHEKLSIQLLVGSLLISIGIVIVSLS